MRHFRYFSVLCGLLLVTVLSCGRSSSAQLADLDLQSGDLVLCSGEQFGDVSFALSCDYSVRETFDLALALLHSFEYNEAQKAFVKTIDGDADCAMAYWGVAMSIYHQLWWEPSEDQLAKGARLIALAKALPQTELERRYIDAIGTYYTDFKTVEHKARAKRYEEKMAALHADFPEDPEAAVFYALALNSTADPQDDNYTNQRKAGRILEELFAERPNHPGIAHYIIHNYDNPVLAPKALTTARVYAQIAPGSAHAQHMPSHIFTRLGLWDESIASNTDSRESALCYSQEMGLEGLYGGAIHAMDYLVYAYLQRGDNAGARAQHELLTRRHNPEAMTGHGSVYPVAAIPARIALENKDWATAATLDPDALAVEWENFPWERAILHYARAIGAARTGDLAAADAEIAGLEQRHQQLRAAEDVYLAAQVEVQLATARAWRAYAAGDTAAGLEQMRLAAELENQTAKHPVTPGEVLPAQELYGDMLLDAGQPEAALATFEHSLSLRPNRFNGLYGAAVAARAAGDAAKARDYFQQLLDLTAGVDSERPELVEARERIAL